MQLNKFLAYIQLLRLNSPTGYILLFWPCSWGVILVGKPINWHLILLFFIGSIIMRSAGCIINDLYDRNIDKQVERTKNRPIASGKITMLEALFVLTLLLGSGLTILLSLNATAIKIGIFSLILVVIYPLMKRVTFFPQLFLGVTFNIGILIGFAAGAETISYLAYILYIGAVLWTLAYDTIYGFQDIKDDKKIKVKSTSIKYEKNYKLFITSAYSGFTILLLLTIYLKNSYFSFINIGLIIVLYSQLLWQVLTLDITNPKNCLKRFKSNNMAGALVFLNLLLAG